MMADSKPTKKTILISDRFLNWETIKSFELCSRVVSLLINRLYSQQSDYSWIYLNLVFSPKNKTAERCLKIRRLETINKNQKERLP